MSSSSKKSKKLNFKFFNVPKGLAEPILKKEIKGSAITPKELLMCIDMAPAEGKYRKQNTFYPVRKNVKVLLSGEGCLAFGYSQFPSLTLNLKNCISEKTKTCLEAIDEQLEASSGALGFEEVRKGKIVNQYGVQLKMALKPMAQVSDEKKLQIEFERRREMLVRGQYCRFVCELTGLYANPRTGHINFVFNCGGLCLIAEPPKVAELSEAEGQEKKAKRRKIDERSSAFMASFM